MDRTGKIILVVSVLAMIFGMPLAMRLGLIKMSPPVADENSTDTNQVAQAGTNTPEETPPNPPAISTSTPAATNQPAPPVGVEIPAVEESTLSLINASGKAMFTFTSLGGGVKRVDLLDYPKEVGGDTGDPVALKNDGGLMPLLALQPPLKLENAPNSPRPYQTNAIPHTLEKVDDYTVRATADLPGGLMRVTKTFTLKGDYQLTAEVVLKNITTNNLPAQGYYLVAGSVAEPESTSRMMGMNFGLMWFDGVEPVSVGPGWFQNYRMGCMCFGSKGERNNYTQGQGNVAWAGAYSRFFAQVTMPENPSQTLVAHQLLVPTQEKPNRKAFETAVALNLPAMVGGQSETYNFTVYTGPREYERLETIGNTHGNQLELIMDFGGWFGWVAKGLMMLMNWFYGVGLSYALAIIAITVLIKIVFWPLTARSTRSMKKMAAVNAKMMPEIKIIRERYKDDYQKMNMKMMEIYKKFGVNPLSQMGGCLPMLIQIPIFFGFFTMLRTAIELRGAEFLWVADLSSPDTVMEIAGFPINIMPLLMTATMFLQMRLQPPSPGMDPAQQAIMKYMPLMFVFILYSASAGLCLYWTVQNVLTIVQTKMTKIPEDENVVEVIQPTKKRKRKDGNL
ncbi:MAG: membrane protein insertase YidC [Verrucomicrobiia bacterium]